MELKDDEPKPEKEPVPVNLHPKHTEDWWWDETIYETSDSRYARVQRNFHRNV